MIEYYPQTIYYPKEEVEKKWRNGELTHVEGRLLDFIRRHAMILMEMAKDETPEPGTEEYLDAIRILVLSKGAIHPPAEMGDIIQEINREIWYQGQRGERDQDKVRELWEQKYAIKWREARLFETFVVLEHIAPKAVQTLLDAVKRFSE
ncbi:MAG TPA: hypothetical protein VLM37_04415 [Fibrobacteraceae bacterium]|nr:hypothetical protein [Fibrobacteraceae bacterium]